MTTVPRTNFESPAAQLGAEKAPLAWAAGVSLGALILYILTLAPTTQFWDASEYIAATHALGIPHAPGNPFFILVAHVWGLLPLAADYGKRINILAAVTSAVTAGLWFLIGERMLRSIVANMTWRPSWNSRTGRKAESFSSGFRLSRLVMLRPRAARPACGIS